MKNYFHSITYFPVTFWPFYSKSPESSSRKSSCQELRLLQRNRCVFIASYRDTTNRELTSWEPMSHCLTTFCLALCSLNYIWSDMRFSKWLSDQFNPLGEFSSMRGEWAPFDSWVQLMTKQPFISFCNLKPVTETKRRVTRRRAQKSNAVNHWINYLNTSTTIQRHRRTQAGQHMFRCWLMWRSFDTEWREAGSRKSSQKNSLLCFILWIRV